MRVLSREEFTRLTATREREFLLIGVREAAGTANKVYVCLKDASNAYVWVQVAP